VSGSAGAKAGSGGATGAAGGGATGATFTAVYAIISTNCTASTCHGAGTRPAGGLAMGDKASAYTNLVGVAATSCTGEKRVVASDADKSELVHALDHTAIGSCTRTPKMPDNKPMLAQADIDTVSSWVKAGALNN
jgi:hypothetical protein